ncbi:MAG: hypothetical protein KDB00_05440 [Planctomycetales bacterium]|nr:hypothetical protein [Planctomycetales bacterium]
MKFDSPKQQRRKLALQRLEHRHVLSGISISAASVSETESHVVFTLELDEAASEIRRYSFDTVDGTAMAGNHYVPVDDLLIEFQPGEVTKTVEVELIDDAIRNLDREFYGRVQQFDDFGRAIVVSNQTLLPADGSIFGFDFDRSGKTLVYSLFTGLTTKLLRIPVDGSSQPTELADLGFVVGNIITNRATNDVILAGQNDLGTSELFRVPIDGSRDPIALTHSSPQAPLVSYRFDPSLTHIVYQMRVPGSTEVALFSVRIDGSRSPVKLFQGDIGNYPTYEISPDGSFVSFQANTYPLPFIMPIDGSTPAKQLSEEFLGASTHSRIEYSPDGQFVYLAARESLDVRQSNLYRFSIDGSQPPLMLASNVGITKPVISKDGSRLVFNIDRGVEAPPDLFSVLSDGSEPPVALHPSIGDNGGALGAFMISSDDQRVIFPSKFEDPSNYALYASKIDGTEAPIKLATLQAPFNVDLILPTDDPDTIVYRTNRSFGNDAPQEVYSVDVLGNSAPKLLSFEVPDNTSYDNYFHVNVHTGSNSVVYTSHRDPGNKRAQLFQAPINGGTTPTLLSQPDIYVHTVSSRGIVETIHGYAYEIKTDGGNLKDQNLVSTKLFEFTPANIIDDDINVVVDDYGDAPSAADSGFRYDYPVTLEDNGSRHTVGDLFLGAGVDAESDGQPYREAGADGLGGDELSGIDDTGIIFLTDVVASSSDTIASVNIKSSGVGLIDAWIDLNRDGDWFDLGEKILHSIPVDAGDNRVSFTIPAGSQSGGTAARFRLSSTGGLGSVGHASDG